MHICFVEKTFPDGRRAAGGSGRYVANIVRELNNYGHIVTIITSPVNRITSLRIKKHSINIAPFYWDNNYIYYLSRIPIINIISKMIEYLLEGWYINRMLKYIHFINKIDIVEFTEGGDFWSTFYKKWPRISHFHCSQYTVLEQCNIKIDLGVKLKRKLEHYFIKRANKVVSPSKSLISIVENEMKYQLKSKQVIPLPIDPQIQNIPYSNEKKEKIIGLFAARTDPLKGGDILLKSISLLDNKIKEKVVFKFFGYNPDMGYKYSYIKFSEFINRRTLLKEIKNADFIVVPSLFENSPNLIYEGMAMGKLIIASNVGGIPELIDHDKNGLLFKKGDYNELAEIITMIIKNPNKIKKIGLDGRRHINNKANYIKNIKIRTKIYKAMIDKHRITKCN